MKQRSQRLKPRLFIEALSFIACFFILTYPLTAAAVQPQVAAGFRHTVGLKSDGTVVAVGNNDYDQLNVGAWSDIKQVAAGTSHTVGLKSDGTVAGYGQLFSYIIDSSFAKNEKFLIISEGLLTALSKSYKAFLSLGSEDAFS